MSDNTVANAAQDFKEVVLDIVEKGHDVKAFAHDIEVSVKKSTPWIRRLVALLFSCMSQKAVSVASSVCPPASQPKALTLECEPPRSSAENSVCPPAALEYEHVVQTSKAVVPQDDEPPALEPNPEASESTDQKEDVSN